VRLNALHEFEKFYRCMMHIPMPCRWYVAFVQSISKNFLGNNHRSF